MYRHLEYCCTHLSIADAWYEESHYNWYIKGHLQQIGSWYLHSFNGLLTRFMKFSYGDLHIMHKLLILHIWFSIHSTGLQDYEAALKIDPNNNEVREDANKIRDVIQKETYSW